MKSRELETWDDDMPTAASSDISDPAEAPSDVDLDGINPVLLSAMIAAIKERPEARGVADTDMVKICVQAMREGTIGDAAWLSKKLLASSAGAAKPEDAPVPESAADESSGATFSVAEEEATPVKSEESAQQVAAQKAIEQIVVPAVRVVTTREELDPVLSRHQTWIAATLDPRSGLIPPGRANLTGSQLQGFDLHDADLRGATLKGVDLSGANLEGANFATANLTGANLAGANLTAANLKRSMLAGADLRGASLRQACLRLSDLEGALYDESQIAEARIVP